MSSLKIITAIALMLTLTVGALCSIGAKPLGLSGAYVAYSEDINSMEWNPAGIAGISTSQLSFSYADLYGLSMIKQSNINIASPLNRSGLVAALSFTNVGLSYNYPSYFNLDNFKWDDSEFSFGLAKMFGNTFLIGTSVKYLRTSSNITNGSANGYGLDAGVIYRLTSDFSLGASVTNLYGRKKWKSGTRETLDRDYRMGGLYKIFNSRLKFSSDIFGSSGSDKTMDGINLGVEYVVLSDFAPSKKDETWKNPYVRGGVAAEPASKYSFALRGGLTRLFYSDNKNKFSLGGTADFGMISLDYAYFYDDKNLGNTHFVTMGLNFGKPFWIRTAERKERLQELEDAKAPPPVLAQQHQPRRPSAPPKASSVPPQRVIQPPYAPPLQARTICVLPFVNNSNTDRLNWLTESMMDMLNKEISLSDIKPVNKNLTLRAMQGLDIRPSEELNPEQVKMLGLILNADKIVVGNFAEGVDSILNVYVRIYDAHTGAISGYESVSGDMVNIFNMSRTLSTKIIDSLK